VRRETRGCTCGEYRPRCSQCSAPPLHGTDIAARSVTATKSNRVSGSRRNYNLGASTTAGDSPARTWEPAKHASLHSPMAHCMHASSSTSESRRVSASSCNGSTGKGLPTRTQPHNTRTRGRTRHAWMQQQRRSTDTPASHCDRGVNAPLEGAAGCTPPWPCPCSAVASARWTATQTHLATESPAVAAPTGSVTHAIRKPRMDTNRKQRKRRAREQNRTST
jgi:hypothetical protein